jgi:hypothetical protein
MEDAPAPAHLEVRGFVDGVFAYNLNRPADHASFFPGVGTSAKRDNELTVNLAQVDIALAPAPVGFKVSLGFGTAAEVVHGWQMISDSNGGKSVGGQVAYRTERLSLSLNGIAGPELADDNHDIRRLVDLVATYKIRPSFSLGVSADVAGEGRPAGDDVSWKGIGLYARFAPPSLRTALAVRGEYYDDRDAAISGIAQTLKEVTATLEHRPAERLIPKLEGRYDRSSATAFVGDERGPDGALLHNRDQFLLLIGAVASF